MPQYAPADTCSGIINASNELQKIVDSYPSATFDIVGHSMGGMTAVYWASKWAGSDPSYLSARIHSIWTIDSPLYGTRFLPSPFTSACAKPNFITCVGGDEAWRQITTCDSDVVNTMKAINQNGISRVAATVPLGHIVTLVGASYPGFWRSYTPCRLSHSCALEQASRLAGIADGIATTMVDDQRVPSVVGWSRVYAPYFIGGSAFSSSTAGALFESSFSGTGVALVYRRVSLTGYLADVSVDGQTPQETQGLNTCSGFDWGHPDLCAVRFPGLTAGAHRISVAVKGCTLCRDPLQVDAIEVLPIAISSPTGASSISIGDALVDMGTITGGVIASAAVLGGAYGVFRRTVGRRGDHYRALRRLGTNAQVSFFSSVLGQPPAMRRQTSLITPQIGLSTGHGSSIEIDCLWVDRDYFVAALADEDESVQAFAVTTRAKSFRPRFESSRGKAHPQLKVQLGKTKFSALKQRPVRILSTLGDRRFGYCEIYYLVNPGHYQYFGCAMNDAGTCDPAGLDLSMSKIDHQPNAEPDPILDGPAVRHFRKNSRVNTWIVFSQTLDPASVPILHWPDADSLRTFA